MGKEKGIKGLSNVVKEMMYLYVVLEYGGVSHVQWRSQEVLYGIASRFQCSTNKLS